MKKIAINKITGSDFTKDTEAKDDYFIELVEKQIKGEVKSEIIVLNIEDITPFSPEFKPKIKPEFVDYFAEKINSGDFPLLHVYYKNKKFIMSDDYNSFYLYKGFGFKEVPCMVYGGIPPEN